MKLTKDQKKEASQKLAEVLKASEFIYFTEYKGLKFTELAGLRSKLKAHKCSYRVVKNSMLEHALEQAGITGVDAKLFAGPNAVLVTKGDDPIGPAKVLVQFAKEFPAMKIKAGLVSSQWMAPAECENLSRLGSKAEVLGRFVGVLYSTVSQSAAVLAAPVRDFVLVLKALEEKKKEGEAKAAA
ncbi:MAG TPA: 50S ribosomal protein L10 [Elusimicrobia bacterium]|nr:50S ribosomal protein L10 [Elusimicrobiota bacterium]